MENDLSIHNGTRLEQLAPGEDLNGKSAKSRSDGAGVQGNIDVVMQHVNLIGIKGALDQ